MHLAGDQFGLENWWYSAYSYGCDKEYYQNLTTGSVNGTVIVTQAGNCPNIQKVFLAHEFGASGIVIVNNRINMHSVMQMNLGELLHRGIEIFVASISLNTFRDQIYYELINAQNSSQNIFLRTVSKNYRKKIKPQMQKTNETIQEFRSFEVRSRAVHTVRKQYLMMFFRIAALFHNLRLLHFSYFVMLHFYYYEIKCFQ